jgi:CubicO group peptidase (beta-lactamase class C family)
MQFAAPRKVSIFAFSTALLVVIGSSRLFGQNPAKDQLRTRVENGLSERVRIEGRPFQHWSIQERMRYYHVPGVQIAVIDQGRMTWAASYGVKVDKGSLVDNETIFQAASVSKVITALTVLRLVDQHRFALDTDANTLLKSWHFPGSPQRATVAQLLSHSAAINWPAGETALLPSGQLPTDLDRLLGRKPALNNPVRIDGTPGTTFRYSNGGYLILGQLVADTTGRSFDAAAQQLVLDPLQMHRSTFRVLTPDHSDPDIASGHDNLGNQEPEGWRIVGMAEGGLWTTATDLAKIILAIQQSYLGDRDFLRHNWLTRCSRRKLTIGASESRSMELEITFDFSTTDPRRATRHG